ncbi:ABC transporter permease [Actinotalea sp. K2]|uniref:ABC transporter permease n=1 Tax=Actinotalea sp. K2 TaxID=2939438 RepID=UPI002017C9F5|nr:ABC transporter permease subunit [Actinotalea sp. K2]MCL3861331.1 ABC transporter permease subunit [Actinotalea sp. K2]
MTATTATPAPPPAGAPAPRRAPVGRRGDPGAGQRRPRRLPRAGQVLRWTYLVALGLFFVVPQLAMARFAFQNVPVALLDRGRLLEGWSLDRLGQALGEPALWEATRTSVVLAVLAIALNLALLLPLAVLAEIRAPHLRPVLTAITLLPWVIPPIALVVGVAATFRAVAPWFLASPLSLVPFYALWAMPFTYRALDAGLRSIHARTLVEAARSLGASWPTVLLRVLAPNLSASVVAACGLTAAAVLGEFAFASLLLKETLPTYLVNYQRSAPQAGMALALAVMVLTALALGAVVQLLRRRGLGVSTTGI